MLIVDFVQRLFIAPVFSCQPAKLIHKVLLLLYCLPVLSCQTQGQYDDLENRVTIVSVNKAAYTMSAYKNAVSWNPDSSYALINEKLESLDYETMLKDAIVEVLEKKGYSYEKSPDKGEFLLSYVIALESEVSDSEVVKRFGLLPGFSVNNPDEDKYQEGTIVVDIFDVSLNATIWRGAVQGFSHKNLSNRERRERLQGVMAELFKQFPSLL